MFRDVLSDGLDYVAGSATINGSAAGSLATFNSTTDELRINFGAGATAGTASTNGGRLLGSKSMGTSGTTGQGQTATITFQARVTANAGYVVKNQASVTYNDYGWESYNASDYTCYSSVTGQTPTAGIETTYVNRFTVLDRTFSGRVWYDASADGMIDTGEARASGLTVSLYNSSDTTYAAPANNLYGNPLTTTTNANGEYSFSYIPYGTYKAVVTTPSGYIVTIKTVSTDNDAVNSGTRAIAGGYNMTTPVSVTNCDFGFATPSMISGRVWVDMDTDGMIDTGETRVLGLTVGLYQNSDTTYSTPVNNLYGSPLVTTTNAIGEYSLSAIPAGTYKVVVTTPGGYAITVKTVTTDNDAVAEGTRSVVSDITLTGLDAISDQDFGLVPKPTVNKTAQVNADGINNGTAAAPVSVGVGDTITYTINAQWSGTYGNASGVNISDTIPQGLSLVTTAGSYTPGMTWSTDASTGLTTVTWANQTLASGLNVYRFQVTVNMPSGAANVTYVNSAVVAVGTSSQTTNSTYHIMNTRTITLSKMVEGTLGDPKQGFTFRVYLTGVTGSLPYTGASTVAGVDAPPNGTIANFGTVTLKHGQSITIENIPMGTVYNFIEINSAGYTVTVTGNNASGTLTDDTAVEFVNTKNEVMPTGVLLDVLPYGIIVALAVCILVVLLILRKRKLKRPERSDSYDRGDYRGL